MRENMAGPFTSHVGVVEHILNKNLHHMDAGQWAGDWKERWVVYADLIAFAPRSLRSRQVVLNNIVRFDRASTIANAMVPGARTFRFSDSTFAIVESAHQAVAYGVALQHACLAMNARVLAGRELFIHRIVPKVTIARGAILALPEAAGPDPKFDGLDPATLVVGEGIVKAHRLERHVGGGAVAISTEDAKHLKMIGSQGEQTRAREAIERFIGVCAGQPDGGYFLRGEVIEVPWLLLRPSQTSPDELWAASKRDADDAIGEFVHVWELSMREFYAPNAAADPLDVSKHFAAGIRHASQCVQLIRGKRSASYLSLEEIKAAVTRK